MTESQRHIGAEMSALAFSHCNANGSARQFTPPSLPPRVPGAPQGKMVVTVDYVHWNPAFKKRHAHLQGPGAGSCCARLLWWGEEGRGTLFRPGVCSSEEEFYSKTSASQALSAHTGAPASSFNQVEFPVNCSAANFVEYLQDMKAVSLDVFDSTGRPLLGSATVATLPFVSGSHTIDDNPPVISKDNVVIGKLHIAISVRFINTSAPIPISPSNSHPNRAPLSTDMEIPSYSSQQQQQGASSSHASDRDPLAANGDGDGDRGLSVNAHVSSLLERGRRLREEMQRDLLLSSGPPLSVRPAAAIAPASTGAAAAALTAQGGHARGLGPGNGAKSVPALPRRADLPKSVDFGSGAPTSPMRAGGDSGGSADPAEAFLRVIGREDITDREAHSLLDQMLCAQEAEVPSKPHARSRTMGTDLSKRAVEVTAGTAAPKTGVSATSLRSHSHTAKPSADAAARPSYVASLAPNPRTASASNTKTPGKAGTAAPSVVRVGPVRGRLPPKLVAVHAASPLVPRNPHLRSLHRTAAAASTASAPASAPNGRPSAAALSPRSVSVAAAPPAVGSTASLASPRRGLGLGLGSGGHAEATFYLYIRKAQLPAVKSIAAGRRPNVFVSFQMFPEFAREKTGTSWANYSPNFRFSYRACKAVSSTFLDVSSTLD